AKAPGNKGTPQSLPGFGGYPRPGRRRKNGATAFFRRGTAFTSPGGCFRRRRPGPVAGGCRQGGRRVGGGLPAGDSSLDPRGKNNRGHGGVGIGLPGGRRLAARAG